MKSPSIFRLTRTLVLLAIPLLILAKPASGQEGQTSMGTDFWLGFMPNSFSPTCCSPQAMEIFIGSGTANTVSVDVYGGNQLPVHQQKQMTANTIWTLYSPEPSPWINYNTEIPAYYAIHVYSTNPVVVYGYQFTGVSTSSTDSYLAIPTPALGTEYYPSCYYDDQYTLGPSNPLAGQFLIISPYDNNVITIGPVKTSTRAEAQPQTPGAVTISHNRNNIWTVTLMKGQTYLVQSTGLGYGNDDLTGTHIVSTKPIGLISGHQLCSIPIGELAAQNGSKDEIMEMIPPVNEWGSEYFNMPTATRTICGDLVRVVAGEDSEYITASSANGNSIADLLHAGDFYDFPQITTPTVFTSQGGKKFLAVQMAYSQGYDGDPGQSDPFSTVLPPLRQFQKEMIFRIPDRTGVSGFTHYGTFICPEDSKTKIILNGKPLSFYTSAGEGVFTGTNPVMAAYRVQFPSGTTIYTATSPVPFGCYLYGWSQFESYGHPASLALGINSSDVLPPLEWQDSQCGTFHVILEDLEPPGFIQFGSRIADIALIADTGDLRWPTPSNNFALSFDSPFTPGDSVAHLTLTVMDPSHNAYAALWTTDRAGNDTVYQFSYTAPLLTPDSNYTIDFTHIQVGSDSCFSFAVHNVGTGPLLLSSVSIKGLDTTKQFTITPSLLNQVIPAGDSISFRLCYTPTDTNAASDTLIVSVGCASFTYPVTGSGTTPLILASDLNFGSVPVGDTICKPLTIQNVGNGPLVLFSNALLTDTVDFSFALAQPDTIAPNQETSLTLCFHPRSSGTLQGQINWHTNLAGPYTHRLKDTSILTGAGVQSSVRSNGSHPAFELSISPNPVTGSTLISIEGTPSANVEIYDVLGREVTNFRVEGSYEWRMVDLPLGTYIVRAEAGDAVISKRLIKQ